ncbi:hypothetical protein Tco_0308636 [Tanacetum coccineum]
MTGDQEPSHQFQFWKFLGTDRFGNDPLAAILVFCDLQWGNIIDTPGFISLRARGTNCSPLGTSVCPLYTQQMSSENENTNTVLVGAAQKQDHPLEQVIGEPSRASIDKDQIAIRKGDYVHVRINSKQLGTQECHRGMTDPAWIESMQEESRHFKMALMKHQIFLAYAAHKSFTVFQMDVKTCFSAAPKRRRVRCQLKVFIDAPEIINPCLQVKEGIIWVKASTKGMAKPTEKHLKEVKGSSLFSVTVNTVLWYSKDSGKKLVSCSSRNQTELRCPTAKQNMFSIRLLCPSPFDADTVNGLWLSLQQDSNLL